MNLFLGGFNCEVDILKQVTGIENDIKIVSTDIIFANISETNLKAAAQLLFYLNHLSVILANCPFIEFNKWFGIWSLFYNDLFKRQPPSKIILTLNRIMKTTSNLSKTAADEIFMRTSTMMSLKYENIQASLPQKLQNSSFTGVSSILQSSKGTCCTFAQIAHFTITYNLSLVSTVTNHPVHIITNENEISPSALIPFCDFGGNKEMGVKINQFDGPVCNSFQAKIQNDQLCYEIDLNKNTNNIYKASKLGFRFILDYNEDRQVIMTNDKNPVVKDEANWFDDFNRNAEADKDKHAMIYLNTIGKRIPG